MGSGTATARLDPTIVKGALYGLGAATLFGLGAPFAKGLVGRTGPLTLAALLYLGAGLFALVLAPVLRKARSGGARGTSRRWQRSDFSFWPGRRPAARSSDRAF